MSRDLGSSSSSSSSNPLSTLLGAEHSGTRVTTEDGKQYLIHKGKGYGNSSQSVITPAKHMSNDWQRAGESYKPNATVGEMMQKSGTGYHETKDNCNHGTARMPNSTVKTNGLKVYSSSTSKEETPPQQRSNKTAVPKITMSTSNNTFGFSCKFHF